MSLCIPLLLPDTDVSVPVSKELTLRNLLYIIEKGNDEHFIASDNPVQWNFTNHELNLKFCRWPNPIYLGAYGGGLFSTLACYTVGIKAHQHQSLLLSLLMWTVVMIHMFLFYKLVTGLDPFVNTYLITWIVNSASPSLTCLGAYWSSSFF